MDRRLNPLTLLCAAVVVVVVTTAVGHLWFSAAVLLAVLVVCGRWGQLDRLLPAAAVVLVPLGLSLLLTHGLFYLQGPTVLFAAGPVRVTTEGLALAAGLELRTAVAVVVFLQLSFSLHPADVLAVLTRYGVAPQVGYVLCATLTLAPTVASQAERIGAAQRARGLVPGGGLAGRLQALSQQVVPLVVSLLQSAGDRAQFLDSRGFGGRTRRTSYRTVPDSAGQRIFRWASMALLALFVAFWFTSGGL